jgi:hypothetical protein
MSENERGKERRGRSSRVTRREKRRGERRG